MAQRKRSVTLTETAYRHCEGLVDDGTYATLDDAASDLIMQVRRGTTPVLPNNAPHMTAIAPNSSQSVSNPGSTTPVLPSTTPVLKETAGAKMARFLMED